MQRSLLFVGMFLLLQGCMLSSTGQKIAVQRLSAFQVDVTTPADVEAALGPPENVAQKPMEQMVVYVYQDITTLAIGVPFPLSVARARQKGTTLNVIFKNGLFKGYELVEMKQKLLWR